MGTRNRSKRRKLDLLVWLYDGRCFWCGGQHQALGDHHESLSIDELKPVSRGGMRMLPNQVPAHKICNMRRGNATAPRTAFERHHATLKAAGIAVEEQ